MRTRPLGLGNTTLQAGDDMYGFYGKHKGIATPNEIISLGGITEGITKNDEYNNPNDDITWLKFSHNYKTLFVADRTILHSVSWDTLDSLDLVFGKVITINGQKYLLRLLQGANSNHSNVGVANSNDEWGSLIAMFTPNTEDNHFNVSDVVNSSGGNSSWLQETSSADISRALVTGNSIYIRLLNTLKSSERINIGYRPVLEVL